MTLDRQMSSLLPQPCPASNRPPFPGEFSPDIPHVSYLSYSKSKRENIDAGMVNSEENLTSSVGAVVNLEIKKRV